MSDKNFKVKYGIDAVGAVTAPTFVGNLVGNADTASTASSATSASSATTAVTSTNLSGGAAYSFPYQTSTGATSMLSAGTSGHFLKTNSTSAAPQWVELDFSYMPSASVKKQVRLATTSNIASLSGAQTIDGIAIANNDRVLVKDQTTASQNGIYLANTSGAWTRVPDADSSSKIAGAIVSVLSGTANGGEVFTTSFKSTDTLGTTAMPWSRVLGNTDSLYIGTTLIQLDRSSASLSLTGISSVSGSTTLDLKSADANAVTLDSGTTGAVNIGTGTNAKSISIGNSTLGTSISLLSGTGGISLLTTGTGTLNIDSGTTGAINIGTGSNAKTVTIGTSTTGGSVVLNNNTTIANNLTVGGNLIVNGTTTTVNSTTVTLDDPILTLGGDIAPSSDDNKDRGIEFRYYDGAARIGFMGYDDSAGRFTMLTAATNTSETFTGTTGTLVANLEGKVNGLTISNTSTGVLTIPDGSTLVTSGAYTLTLTAVGNSTITFPAGTKTLAANDQTFYLGSTQVAINRTSAVMALTGITSIDGSAGSLTTARTLWGQSFNGTANVSGNLTSVGNITGSGAMTISSAAATTMTIESGTTGNIEIGTGSNAKIIALGNAGVASTIYLNNLTYYSGKFIPYGTSSRMVIPVGTNMYAV